MALAPVLLFTYNRPLHTQQTLKALRNNALCAESELFVFSDGYKDDADKQAVMEVRQLIASLDGFKKIHLVENKQNLGLAKNIIDGVTRVMEQFGKVIVLEDDLITSPYFLTFMNDALNKFENEEKIGHIHAFCYPNLNLPDTFLIKWTGSWGWATWQRAWKHFNPDGKALLRELESRKLTKTFDFNNSYPYTRMLYRQTVGINNSWAIRWNASLFLQNILSVNAGKSLVQNIGFDGSGTHSGSQEIYTTPLYEKKPEINIPQITENKKAREAYQKYYIQTNGFWAKLKRRIKRIINPVSL